MRWLLVVGTVCATATLAGVPTAFAGTTNPCVLVTVTDAATVLGAKPAAGKLKAVGLYKSCTYSAKRKTMTVQTRAIPKEADFKKSAKATGLVIPISGIGGADAYSADGGTALLVWKNGTEITFTFVGVNPFVATQQSLAKTALGRL